MRLAVQREQLVEEDGPLESRARMPMRLYYVTKMP